MMDGVDGEGCDDGTEGGGRNEEEVGERKEDDEAGREDGEGLIKGRWRLAPWIR